MVVLFIVGVLAVALGVIVIALGTVTTRALKTPSYPLGTPTNSSTCFPSDYHTARQAFLDSVASSGGRLESIEHPEKGPSGESLFMDVASFGDEAARRTLVISSGTHGVEGFAGSGIQTRLLREGVVSDLPPSVNFLMVHAINPYGMAHWRRVNEDNVDVNRNFRDHSVPISTSNTAYARLSDVIAPDSISFWREVASWWKLLHFRQTHGPDQLQAAVSKGQYEYPEGLFHGGKSETWSNRTLRSVIARYLGEADRVVVVDIHTGLGEYSHGEIILSEGTLQFQRALGIWGSDVVRSSVTGDSVSVRIDALMQRAFSETLGEDVETTSGTLEFGTLPPMDVFVALRAENWLHHHGRDDPRAKKIKTCLLRAFHPGLREWEDAVWEQGRNAIERALNYLDAAGP